MNLFNHNIHLMLSPFDFAEDCHRKVRHIEKKCEKAYSMFTQDEGEYSYGWKKVNYSGDLIFKL